MVEPHSSIAGYIDELNRPSAVYNTSHFTLYDLYRVFGVEFIDQKLKEYWDAVREYNNAKTNH